EFDVASHLNIAKKSPRCRSDPGHPGSLPEARLHRAEDPAALLNLGVTPHAVPCRAVQPIRDLPCGVIHAKDSTLVGYMGKALNAGGMVAVSTSSSAAVAKTANPCLWPVALHAHAMSGVVCAEYPRATGAIGQTQHPCPTRAPSCRRVGRVVAAENSKICTA